jgi:sugar lactone lactonase YvrE
MKKILLPLFCTLLGIYSTDAFSQTIATLAGDGVLGYSGDGGSAISAAINNPFSMAVDKAGNVYISDQNNHRIRKVDTFGTITNIAGTGVGGYDGDGAPATAKELYYPAGIAVDSGGNIYVADYGNHRVRKITKSTGLISTIGGTTTYGFSGDGGPATAAKIHNPYGLAIDTARNIYFADRSNHRIRKISNTGIITTIAGTAPEGFGGDGGQATAANLKYPIGVAVDTFGDVYFSDWGNNRIRKVTKLTGVIKTIAGTGVAGYSGDGAAATLAKLNQPYGVAVDGSGKVYIGEFTNSRVRMIDSLGIITTFAGKGTRAYSGDGGLATAASLIQPSGVAVDSFRNVYIADHYNNRVRIVYAGGVISGVKAVCVGSSTTLNDPVPGGAWRSSTTSVAIVGSSTGIVTGVSAGTSSITYEAPAYYGHQYSVATVTVNPLPASISGPGTVCAGGTSTLTDAGGGKWFSSTTTVARIGSSSGRVSGVLPGTATITYRLATGCSITKVITVDVCSAMPISITPGGEGAGGGGEENNAQQGGVITTSSSQPGLHVYPNPNDGGAFTVFFSSNKDEQGILTITNTVGQKVIEMPVTTNTTIPITKTSLLPPGMYLVTLKTEHERFYEKMVVNR